MTYIEEYYKRLSEQLNERYINLQKLSLLLETPGIEDVKKHFGTMREDQFEEYMKSDPGIEERARAFRKEYLDQANAGQSSRSQSRQSSQSSGSQSSQGSSSQGSQRSSSQGSSSQGSQRSSSQGSSSQGSKSYYGPYSSAQGDQWAHMSDWDFNHDWIHRPENAEFKNNRTYAEAAWRAAQSRANAAKNQSSQGSQSNSAGNAGQSKASPPPEPPPPPPPPAAEPLPTSAGQRWKNAGAQSSKTIEDVITRVSNIGNNAARYAKNIPYSTIGKNVGKGAATLGVGVGVDLATQKALDSAGYKDKTGKEMIGAQVGGAASGVMGGALAGTALLPAAVTGAVAGGVGYGAYKVGETIGDKTGFHDAIGNYFGGASKLNEPKTGYNGNFGTTPRYKENIKDENSKAKLVNISDIINRIIHQ